MIETVSKKVTSFFIEKEIIEESKRNMCEYSLYTRMLTCITVLFMLGISIPAIGLFKSFILIIGILALRKRTGGFHANGAEKCFLLSNMVIFVLTWIIYPIFNEFRIIILSMMYTISILLICFISPINHPNNPLGDDELKANKIIVIKIVLLLSIAFLMGIIFTRLNSYSVVITLITITVMLSLMIAKILNQEV